MKKYIPNFLTLINLFSGSLSALFIFRDNYQLAAYFFVLSLITDLFDGMTSRWLNLKSELGKQLDSLADVVSFGFTPSMIMFKMMNDAIIYDSSSHVLFTIDGNLSVKTLFAFLIVVYSALRLAKFNIDVRQTDSFIGLPTPANAMFIYSLPFILMYNPDSWMASALRNYSVLLGITLVMSMLLVSEIKLFALKFKTISFADNKVIYLFLGISLILIVLFKVVAIPFVIFTYILISIIDNFIRKK